MVREQSLAETSASCLVRRWREILLQRIDSALKFQFCDDILLSKVDSTAIHPSMIKDLGISGIYCCTDSLLSPSLHFITIQIIQRWS
jgi:hypothetical protein